MLLLLYYILLKNLFYNLVSFAFSELQFEFSKFFTDTFLSLVTGSFKPSGLFPPALQK